LQVGVALDQFERLVELSVVDEQLHGRVGLRSRRPERRLVDGVPEPRLVWIEGPPHRVVGQIGPRRNPTIPAVAMQRLSWSAASAANGSSMTMPCSRSNSAATSRVYQLSVHSQMG
jgi:hypothetical protein